MSLSRRDFSCSPAMDGCASLDVALAASRLRRSMCWRLADHDSRLQEYRPRNDGRPQRCLPFDERLQPKPLRAAIAGALRAMPAR